MNLSSTPKSVLLHIIFPFETNGQQQKDFLLKQQNSTQGQNNICVIYFSVSYDLPTAHNFLCVSH